MNTFSADRVVKGASYSSTIFSEKPVSTPGSSPRAGFFRGLEAANHPVAGRPLRGVNRYAKAV
jgi:hypothetical protein